MEVSDNAVRAAQKAYRECEGDGTESHRAALTAALPFLPVQGAVKKLEWELVSGDHYAEGAGTHYNIYETKPGLWNSVTVKPGNVRLATNVDLEAAKSAAQSDYEDRILSALEPSAARELALEALRSAEQFIENGFEFGFIRKPDEGDTALETLPKIKAAIRDLQSNAADARPLALEEGFRKGLEAACDVIDAHNEYDRRMCCDGRECGCYGATVHQSMQHYIRSLSSPDHADAGKVEGNGEKWPMRELIAKAMAYQSVGDPHAKTVHGNQRWEWFVEDADKFINAFGYYLPALPSAPASEGAE